MIGFELFSYLAKCRKAIVLGIGGGGDIFATIPTRNFLKKLGLEVYVGCVAWERFVVDPKPGPRSLEELENIIKVSETVCIGGPNTVTNDGIKLQASHLSEKLNEEVVLVDITKGVANTSRGLDEALSRLNVDLLIGVDGGGDVLARGVEKNLRSPLCDSIMLASLYNMKKENFLGVFGVGCDGELSIEEILIYISDIASHDGYLGAYGMSREDVEILEMLTFGMPSEVSKIALLSFKGRRGEVWIRDGLWRAETSMISTITFYLDTEKTYSLSPLAKAVSSSKDIFEANQRLNEMGIKTELDLEIEAYRKGAKSYRELFKEDSKKY
ncbi:MAG: DUF1152 domain-containing protein [Aigarchaeota archaeon]|nr:DUF1152 domain-containing protein [Aigarchaeota archaeon]